MRPIRTAVHATALMLTLAAPAFCQLAPPPPRTLSLSGPRFGITALSPGVVNELQAQNVQVRPMVTQFGWQLERQFFTKDSGVSAVTEWVGLLGGLEQGLAIPSLSWLVGLRSHEGAEIGVGPNVTPGGVALALAGGITFRSGPINVPVNFAVVPSRAGTRVSVLTGFTLRR